MAWFLFIAYRKMVGGERETEGIIKEKRTRFGKSSSFLIVKNKKVCFGESTKDMTGQLKVDM